MFIQEAREALERMCTIYARRGTLVASAGETTAPARLLRAGSTPEELAVIDDWVQEHGRTLLGERLFQLFELGGLPLEFEANAVVAATVANLLAVWAVHDLGPAMRAAWEAGVVLSGVSAGSICWYLGGCTDSFGPELRAVTNGLGLLPYGNGVHYDSEASRRPTIHRLVGNGTLPVTHCSDDGVGLVYHGTELVEAVAEVDGKGAYVVERSGAEVVETRIEPRRLKNP